MTADVPLALAGEFPAAEPTGWRRAVEKVLAKGSDLDQGSLDAAFERELVTTTVEGVRIDPLYVADGAPPAERVGLPGAAPFVRGTRPRGSGAHGWQVRQRVVVGDDPAAAADVALTELERGTTALWLDLTACPTIDAEVLGAALDGVYLDLVPVVLDAGGRWSEACAALHQLWIRQGVAPGTAAAVMGADPIGRWAELGGAVDLDQLVESAVWWSIRHATSWPSVRTVVVDAARFHEAGAAEIDELATSLALGVAYLRALTQGGLDVDQACAQLEFRFAATPDQFLTIAKLRAARRLWQRAVEVSGGSPDAQRQVQHAVTSSAAATRYDVWVNLLRSTVECFAAGVGGADSVTVLPHDGLVDPEGSELGRRLARNAQVVLIEESHLARVVDIAGGSWYVESLTDDLAHRAWDRFREIEAEGGIVATLRSGLVQDRIAGVSTERDARIASRRWPLTGLSEFPEIGEEPPPALDPAPTRTSTPFPAVVPRRWSEGFERQRGRADAVERTTGRRPEVLLVCLGPVARHTARATFAKNLFEVGGIRSVASPPLTSGADAVAALGDSGASLVCICGSDDTYEELAVEVASALHAAGPARLYLAGQPKALLGELTAAGVDDHLRAGGDALALLTAALDAIGAPR